MRTSRALPALLSLVLAAPAGLSAQGFVGTLKHTQLMVMPEGVAALAGADATDPVTILEALGSKLKDADPSLVITQQITVTVKGAKMRLDGVAVGAGADVYLVLDAGARMVYQVMPSQNQIMTISIAETPRVAARMAEMGMTPPASPAPITTTVLGVKTIGGVQAQGFRVTTADGVGEIWVDPALKDAFAAFKDFQQTMGVVNPVNGQLQAALQAFGFPVLLEFVSKASPMMGEGFVYTRSEVAQVQRRPVADGVFRLPADFNKLSIAGSLGINPQ